MPTKAKARTNGAGPNREQRRYKRARTVLLKFADEEMEGLEVRTKRVALGDSLDLIDKADQADEANDRERIEDLIQDFAEKVLLSWNLDEDVYDDDGVETGEVVAVPPTAEGLMSLDLAFVMSIVGAWVESVAGVSGPLDTTSPGGGPAAESSIPMEPLSESPGS